MTTRSVRVGRASTVIRQSRTITPSTSLALQTRVKSEVIEALLYGCATWTPLKGDYQKKLCAANHRILFRILGAWCRSRDRRTLSYDIALQRTDCENIENIVRTRRLLWAGALIRIDICRLPKGIMVGTPQKRVGVDEGQRERVGELLSGRPPVRNRGWGGMEN